MRLKDHKRTQEGIGNTTLSAVEELAAERNCSIFAIVRSATEIPELKRAAEKLVGFAGMIAGFRALSESMSVPELIENVITKSRILDELESENTEEARTRIENIKELMSGAIDFEAERGKRARRLPCQCFTGDGHRQYGRGQGQCCPDDAAQRQGLEFLSYSYPEFENVFPGTRSMESDTGLEEERRLCYVGITRAMEKALLHQRPYEEAFRQHPSYNRCSGSWRNPG